MRRSTNESVDHGPADLLAQFRQTGQLPATLALAVALVVIQPRPATAEAAAGPDNDS